MTTKDEKSKESASVSDAPLNLGALMLKAKAIADEPNKATRRRLREAVPVGERLYVYAYLDQIAASRRKKNAYHAYGGNKRWNREDWSKED